MRKLKKMIGIVLTLAMVLSMSTAAFAAEETYSITITDTVDGETYSAYKIFDVTYSGNSYSYTIDSSSAWFATVDAAKDVFTLAPVGDSTTYIVTVNEGVEDDAITIVFTTAGVPAGAEADAEATAANGQAFLDLTSSGAGYYYVTTSLGSLVMIDTTNPDPEIKEKNGIPTITKEEQDMTFDENFVGNGTTESDNGDTMKYRLVVSDIHDVNNLVIHDYLDDQLDISTLDIDSITIIDGTTTKTLVYETDYDYTTTTCNGDNCGMDGCSFEITIHEDILKGLSDSAYLEIVYEIEIDEDSDAFEDLKDEIDNYANVTFGASGKGTPAEVETFSFGFNIYKYTGDIEESEDEALSGAKFVLKNSSGKYAKFTETGEGTYVYLLDEWVESIDEATEIETPEDGKFTVEGLHDGTYYLEETEAPEGYNKLTSDIIVVIAATGDITVDGETASDKTANVENNTGSILPGTGGMGTTIFYVIGVILVLGAAIVLVTRRRMANAQ